MAVAFGHIREFELGTEVHGIGVFGKGTTVFRCK